MYVQQSRLSGGIAGLLSKSIVWHQIETLNLSLNSFSGEIPRSLANISCLTYLDLHSNEFTSAISPELGSLSHLIYLDISDNYLIGVVPDELCDLMDLNFFNLPDNLLEGAIPKGGGCSNFTASSFVRNKGLCGNLIGHN